ncbi:MAG: proton-conducting transporter membrane subunit, partial [Bacteroidia bacterium]|nr:proton-conducting transporter membrane subunit [Bacteroidia bacterium]
MNALAPWVVLLPLIGATIIGLGGFVFPAFRERKTLIGALATLCVAVPFAIILGIFWGYEGQALKIELFSWMKTGKLDLSFGYTFDELSLLMGMIVTGVGALIHLYSIGYMHADPGYYKFFLYLNLFIFAMLNLVLGDNMVVTFLGWEGVGACSYFLIGFWYTDMEKAKAAQKAFVANRIGDFAFLVAMFIVFFELGTLRYDGIAVTGDTAYWVGLLLFIAATGKSAQIPLFVWLPDAMAGPTPVSALIHAATMVTSGIYLIARASPGIYMQPGAEGVLTLISIVGGLTAIMAALIAVTQYDIKRVLAYSTVSQLGFMFV